jgi:hypothetical protein
MFVGSLGFVHGNISPVSEMKSCSSESSSEFNEVSDGPFKKEQPCKFKQL